MRIAVFTRYPRNLEQPRGGIEAVAVVLVPALASLQDLEVHVITLEREQSKLEIQQMGDVTVHRLPGARWPQISDVLFGPGKRRLVRHVISLKPDVLHTHETYGLGLANLPISHVFTVHGFDHANLPAAHSPFACLRAPLWRQVERFGLSRQKHIISISPYVRKMLEPQTRATIYDIDNPVDERFFHLSRSPEAGRVICVGWINHRKNTLGAVEAVARVARQGAAVKLIIAGESKEPDYRQRVEACIEKHGLTERVEFAGRLDRARLLEELGRAAVFLLPSRQENAPMAISEAMAVGCPVIAANRCGIPYMVREGASGFLIDPEDSDQIGDRLARLLANPELAREMGRCGRQIAEQRFRPSVVAQSTREVYRGLCANIGKKVPAARQTAAG